MQGSSFRLFRMASSAVVEGQRVVVMRHGERLDHVSPVQWAKVRGDRPYDPPLTDKGRKECFQIAKDQLKDKGISKVYSSPFLRCLQTAQQACDVLDLPGIALSNGMCEVLSPGFGVSRPPVVPADNLHNHFITVIQSDDAVLPKYPEDFRDAMDRYGKAINCIADTCYPSNVLIVTHAYGVEKAYEIGLNAEPFYNLPDYCAQVELVRADKEGAWSLKSTFRVD